VSGVGSLAMWGVPRLVLEVVLPTLTSRMRATTQTKSTGVDAKQSWPTARW